MSRCKKLTLNLTAANLFSGKIDLRITRDFSCFFIVNSTNNREFIEKTALDFILSGCKDFHFFGIYEPEWHLAFDLKDSMVFPNSTSETVARTSGYDSIEDFSEALHEMISVRAFVPRDYFLIYDDEELYRKIISILGLMG